MAPRHVSRVVSALTTPTKRARSCACHAKRPLCAHRSACHAKRRQLAPNAAPAAQNESTATKCAAPLPDPTSTTSATTSTASNYARHAQRRQRQPSSHQALCLPHQLAPNAAPATNEPGQADQTRTPSTRIIDRSSATPASKMSSVCTNRSLCHMKRRHTPPNAAPATQNEPANPRRPNARCLRLPRRANQGRAQVRPGPHKYHQ